jgi:hypothetical protein
LTLEFDLRAFLKEYSYRVRYEVELSKRHGELTNAAANENPPRPNDCMIDS